MLVWGFFSAWGWIGATYVKEQIWPEKPPAQIQSTEKQDAARNEESKKSGS